MDKKAFMIPRAVKSRNGGGAKGGIIVHPYELIQSELGGISDIHQKIRFTLPLSQLEDQVSEVRNNTTSPLRLLRQCQHLCRVLRPTVVHPFHCLPSFIGIVSDGY